jgi:hypothetical protein
LQSKACRSRSNRVKPRERVLSYLLGVVIPGPATRAAASTSG